MGSDRLRDLHSYCGIIAKGVPGTQVVGTRRLQLTLLVVLLSFIVLLVVPLAFHYLKQFRNPQVLTLFVYPANMS